jgi:hypothetical protein
MLVKEREWHYLDHDVAGPSKGYHHDIRPPILSHRVGANGIGNTDDTEGRYEMLVPEVALETDTRFHLNSVIASLLNGFLSPPPRIVSVLSRISRRGPRISESN